MLDPSTFIENVQKALWLLAFGTLAGGFVVVMCVFRTWLKKLHGH